MQNLKTFEDLLKPTNLDISRLDNLISVLMSSGADFSDIYIAKDYYESFHLEDGIIKNTSASSDFGAGLRACYLDKTGFAYTQDLSFSELKKASKFASKLHQYPSIKPVAIKHKINQQELYSTQFPDNNLKDKEKADLLKTLEKKCFALDERIKKVFATLALSYEKVLIVNSIGTLAEDIRPMVRLSVKVLLEDKNQFETGNASAGGRDSLSIFDDEKLSDLATSAVKQAQINLKAKECPAGKMAVVLANGWPGVLLHEAVGHGLEADFNRLGSSVFSKKMGEKVATSLCTIVDNGTLKNHRGSLNIDDEGNPTQNTVLIENGILKNYLFDRMNANLMKQKKSANGRRESYAHLPMPRMTNTYMLAGKSEPDEIIASLNEGIYAVNFSGGQVDITSGDFVFSANEAYYVKNGKIQYPVKGATLIGNGPEVIQKISMVANDLKIDKGTGTCGKNGQSVPVCVGQPTLRVDELTVGGTK